MIKHCRVGFVLLIAIVLRIPLLNGSFWLDEAAQAIESVRPLVQQLEIQADFQPPLYHLWVHLFTYISASEWWLRQASLLPAIGTIYCFYLLGSKLQGQKTGVFAALLLATSQFHVFYSQELRPYSLAAFWGMLSLLILVNLSKKFSSKNLVLFSLVNLGGMYTVYTFFFFTLSQLFGLIISKKIPFKHLALTITLLCIGYIPWIIPLSQQLETSRSVRQTLFGWEQVVAYPLDKAIPLTLVKFTFGRLIIPNSLFIEVALTAIAVLFLGISIKLSQLKHKKLIFITLILPFILALLTSLTIPLIDPKRFLFLLPLVYIFISSLNHHPKGKLLIPIILLINSIGLVRYWTNPNDQREPWREAITAIQENSQYSNAAVVTTFSPSLAPLMYYPLNLPLHAPNNLQVNNYQRLYYFQYLQSISDPHQLVRQSLKQQGFAETGFLQYPGIGKIVIMDRAHSNFIYP